MIKGVNSINTCNNSNLMTSQIIKEIILKFYQNNIKFMIYTLFSEREFIEYYKILYKNKLSSYNLNILIFEVKLTFELVKQAHYNNKKVDIINFTLGRKHVSQLITLL